MTVAFTNTLGGSKGVFEPLQPPRVTVYVCGPTVYDVPHIGHARAAVVFDVLRRHLTGRGYDVLHVQNVTDVDDKIIHAAAHEGVDAAIVAERYSRVYDDAMRRLGVLPPDIAPRASGHVPEMVEMISKLIDEGFAYTGEGSVWFAVEKFGGYGKLSGNTIEGLRAGERVEPEAGTLSPLDFALWKAAKPGEPSWPSPWGRGRPGWHIECSAMAVRYLGAPFDIHCGGSDLIFPHHENEIAQTEAALGSSPAAVWWLHNGHVQIDGEKMSKSLRNYVRIDEALADYPPQAVRLFILSAHYRSPMAYAPGALDEAKSVWGRFVSFLRAAPRDGAPRDDLLEAFGSALDDDLNTPQALAALHALVSSGNQALEARRKSDAADARASLVTALETLGCEPEVDDGSVALAPLVGYLIELRQKAREARDFAHADAIRSRLASAGITLEDTPQGTRWHAGS